MITIFQIKSKVVYPEILNQTFPNLTIDGSSALVFNPASVILGGIPRFQSITAMATVEIEAKCKSQAAIRRLLPNATYGTSTTCKGINQDAFRVALTFSSNIAKIRYGLRGRDIAFSDDVLSQSVEEWNFSSIGLGYLPGNATPGFIVTSPAYVTPVQPKPGHLSGVHFCKLLSPLRALEWIYVDSLKPYRT
ncbi:uncharacterized protein LOC106162609 [Lingula anatina]|uniref:Uncharacterized protein LOC106162609 n=1 Tax=Lingula anatina TaxID=7574 RepID=A0A2R2MNF7_LINAN|nr:uncharacterized protein LOC106162609 [Lingula anatina]|eukprot:XP_023931745.1 uncharacterized protein LOC106162609 [Lingula anatina]